jgi:TolA protein
MEKTQVQGILHQPQPGFYKVVLISFLLHAVALSGGMLLVKGEPGRIFYAPVYTTVDLVAPPSVKPKPGKRIKRPKKKAPVKVVKKATPAAKKPVKEKKKAVLPPPTAEKPDEEKIYLSEAIKKIEQEARTKQEEKLVTSRIEDIKKKAEAEREKLEELRKAIAEEEEIGRRIEELRDEIETAESEARTVEAAPSDMIPTDMTSRAAPRSIRRELFDLEFKSYYNKVGSMIQSLWIYTGAGNGLETVLSIKIARSGELKKIAVEKRSGNALFDESAKRAVKKAAPYPPLPEGLGGDFLELGIRFCPGGCRRLL